MSKFATGKHAFGISDRSGFRYRLKNMRKEWNGLLVGRDEWEEKHPNWEDTDQGRGEYIKIVQSAMKDVSESPTENKIIKNIVKETVISKEVLTDK